MNISTNNYENTYGRKPRGKGFWAFRCEVDRDNGTKMLCVEFAPVGLTYSAAKRWVTKRAAAIGAARVEVAS
jgi:hypothetical protein